MLVQFLTKFATEVRKKTEFFLFIIKKKDC
jgi:hypothetical protein